jgi:subfamily B ATP-binding cassette protein MsbA
MTQGQTPGSLLRLLGYIRPYWKAVAGAFVFTLAVTGTRLSQARFVALIFALMTADQFNYSHGFDPVLRLNLITLAFLGVMLVQGLCTYFQKYLVDLGGQLALRDFRQQVFEKLQRMSLSFYHSMRLGEIHSRASNDIQTAGLLFPTLAEFTKNMLIVVLALGWMFWRDWQMTALVLLLSPLIGTAVSRFSARVSLITERLQARLADLSAILYENISGMQLVQAYTREAHEIARFRCKNEENYTAQMKLVQVSALQLPVVEFLGAFGIVAIIWFGALRILQGQVTFTQMTEYWTLMILTSQPISELSKFYAAASQSAAAARRVFEILDARPDIEEAPDAVELPSVQGRLELRGVSFEYEAGKRALVDIDLTVQPGEVVALVGPNGSGKTTLVNLVPRFYDPTAGLVLLDGHPLTRLKLAWLRRQVGLVTQEAVLFAGTVRENIAFGNPRASLEQIERAARLAGAHEFIERLPQGYETPVGERGLRLSGGQRQRLAIARALLLDPRILILDEFTSGFDTEAENLITEAIDRAMKGRTCLVIAHRLNTIRHADRIVVMDRGRIVEMGSHEELLCRGGLYTRLFEAHLRHPVAAGSELS